MTHPAIPSFVTLTVGVCLLAIAACSPSSAERPAFPDAVTDVSAKPDEATRTAILAGGCFWGVEAVFEHVNGVQDVVSGFMSGAEVVRITYHPSKISYGQLLKVFFSVAHDPTQLNRQGPDIGPQYRSAIFTADSAEHAAAKAYIEQLTNAKIYRKPIVTEVAPVQTFKIAGPEHQDYAARNPKAPYVVINDAPKIAKLKRDLPALYKDG